MRGRFLRPLRHVRTHQTRRTSAASTVSAMPTMEMEVERTVRAERAMTSWPSGVVSVTSTGRRSPEVTERACMRTGVVGWSRVSVRALPSGKANLSLLNDRTTFTGNGAEEITDTGMEAVRDVKVMVFWAARETRLTSTPKRWTKTASTAAR